MRAAPLAPLQLPDNGLVVAEEEVKVCPRHPAVPRRGEARALPRGAWTDDTAMFLCLAHSLLERIEIETEALQQIAILNGRLLDQLSMI